MGIYEKTCALKPKAFKKVKTKLIELKNKNWGSRHLCAEIYNLWSDYLISEEQEAELYAIADPTDEVKAPADDWYSDQYGCTELFKLFDEFTPADWEEEEE